MQFEARLWDGRAGRWMTTDPAGQYWSLYLGMGNNPVNGVDPDGCTAQTSEDAIVGSDGTFRGFDEYGNNKKVIVYDGEFLGGMSQEYILNNGGVSLHDFFLKNHFNLGQVSDFTTKINNSYHDFLHVESLILSAKLIKEITEMVIWMQGAAAGTEANVVRKGLTNSQVRLWYSNSVKALNTELEPTVANARKIIGQRNALKNQARALMADRKAALRLEKTDPIRNYQYYYDKYYNQGFRGNSIYERIIQGASTPNAKVNAKFGL